jgi:hypothetical protein
MMSDELGHMFASPHQEDRAPGATAVAVRTPDQAPPATSPTGALQGMQPGAAGHAPLPTLTAQEIHELQQALLQQEVATVQPAGAASLQLPQVKVEATDLALPPQQGLSAEEEAQLQELLLQQALQQAHHGCITQAQQQQLLAAAGLSLPADAPADSTLLEYLGQHTGGLPADGGPQGRGLAAVLSAAHTVLGHLDGVLPSGGSLDSHQTSALGCGTAAGRGQHWAAGCRQQQALPGQQQSPRAAAAALSVDLPASIGSSGLVMGSDRAAARAAGGAAAGMARVAREEGQAATPGSHHSHMAGGC